MDQQIIKELFDDFHLNTNFPKIYKIQWLTQLLFHVETTLSHIDMTRVTVTSAATPNSDLGHTTAYDSSDKSSSSFSRHQLIRRGPTAIMAFNEMLCLKLCFFLLTLIQGYNLENSVLRGRGRNLGNLSIKHNV